MKVRTRGFTLIELLVVIAIVAILAGVLFPVFSTAKHKSLQTSCANNMRQMTIALLNYADDWNGCLPGLKAYGAVYAGTGKHTETPIGRYLKNGAVMQCPEDVQHRTSKMNFTYPMNGFMTLLQDGESRSKADVAGRLLSKSRNPGQTVLLVDENTDTRKNGGLIVNDGLFIWQDRTCDRHPGSRVGGDSTCSKDGVANITYVDSHVGIAPGLLEWDSQAGQKLFCR